MIKRILNLLLILGLTIASMLSICWFLMAFVPDWLITGKTKHSLAVCVKWFEYQEPILLKIEKTLFNGN